MTYDQNQQKNLDEQLESLRSDLLGAQDKLKKAETEIKAGEEQIKTIEDLIKKFNQIVADYREAYPGLLTRQQDFEQTGKDERKCLENILNEEEQKKVRCIVNKERQDITELAVKIQGYIDDLDGNCTKEKCKDCDCKDGMRKELDDNKNALDDAKKKYELWIDPVKSIESRFKTLETIKKEIDKEHTAGNHAYAYYLLVVSENSFCGHLDGKPDVVKPECLEKELKAAWNEYSTADKCFNKTDGKVKSAERNLETSQAQLAEDKKNLEATIKRRLTNLADEEYKEGDCPPDTSEDKDKCSNDDSTQT